MRKRKRKAISLILAMAMLISLFQGILPVNGAEKTMVSVDASASDWTSVNLMASDVEGGAGFDGTAGVYGTGAALNTKLDVSEAVEFDLKFTKEEMAVDSLFAITFGTDTDSFNNASKGVTYIMYKKADNVIECDKKTEEGWREYTYGNVNTFRFAKESDGWALYLKGAGAEQTDILLGKVGFDAYAANGFADGQANFGVYVLDEKKTTNEVAFEVTNVKHMVVQETVEEPMVSVDASASNWTTVNLTTSDVEGGAGFDGTAGVYGTGAALNTKLDVSEAVEFELKFMKEEMAVDSLFAITFGTDTDSFNNASKGVTYIMYKKADNVIECDKKTEEGWREYTYGNVSTFRFAKESDGWALYLKGAGAEQTDILVGKVGFDAYAADGFANGQANLGVYVLDQTNTTNEVAFEVTNVKHMVTKYVLPTNASHWMCVNNSTILNGIITLNESGIANYSGNKLDDKLAQFEMEAEIPTGKWIGMMAKQSEVGEPPWNQECYLVIISDTGVVQLLRYKDGAETELVNKETEVVQNGVLEKTMIRFGVINEDEGARIILDIAGENILNHLDTQNPITESGYTGFITLETATANIYAKGVVEFGYTGGEINHDYIIDWPIISDYQYKGNSDEGYVHPEEIVNQIDVMDTVAKIKAPGTVDVVVAVRKPQIIDKSIFENLAGQDKHFIVKVVNKEGKILSELSIYGGDLGETATYEDYDMAAGNVSVDVSASNWTPTNLTATDVEGGAGFYGTAGVYGTGAALNTKLHVSGAVEFELQFTKEEMAAGVGLFAITFGTDTHSFNNPSKGVTYIMYKKADNVIECDKRTEESWREYIFENVNTFRFAKESDGWALYLKGTGAEQTNILLGKIGFGAFAADGFADGQANFGVYVLDNTMNEVAFEVTNVKCYGNVTGSPIYLDFTKNIDYYRESVEVPEYQDMVFAGWYNEEWKVLQKDEEATTYYAKFLPKDVLEVKAQLKLADGVKTTDASGKTEMRLITTVDDSLDYMEVGFIVTSGTNSKIYSRTKAYDTLVAADVDVIPSEFHICSKRFITVNIGDITWNEETKLVDRPITVQAYWKTYDGTIVYGTARTLTIQQGLDAIAAATQPYSL